MSEPRVIVAGWYAVDPKQRDRLVESFKELLLRARRAPGCLDVAFTADPIDPKRVNVFEFWRSEEDLKAWRASCRPPKTVTRILRAKVLKHVVAHSGPPFGRRS